MARRRGNPLSTAPARAGLIAAILIAVSLTVLVFTVTPPDRRVLAFAGVLLALGSLLAAPDLTGGPAMLILRGAIRATRPWIRRERFLLIALAGEDDPQARDLLQRELDQLRFSYDQRRLRATRLKDSAAAHGMTILLGLLAAIVAAVVLRASGYRMAASIVLLVSELAALLILIGLYLTLTLATLMAITPLVGEADVARAEAEALDADTHPYWAAALVVVLIGAVLGVVYA